MRFKQKRRKEIIKTYFIGWTIAFIILCIIRGVGTNEVSLETQFDFTTSIAMSLILGPLFGLPSGLLQILIEEKVYKRMPVRTLLLIKFSYTVLFMLLLVTAGYGLSRLFLGTTQSYRSFAFDAGSLAIYFYIVLVEVFMTVLNEVKLTFGGNKLVQLLRGKFYTPGEEERIFMFLDLQSSTAHAEKLGHMRYSQLIQECFSDLGVVAQNDAEIYQYVGDEAVLSWKLKDGITNGNCIKAFFNFKNRLKRKREIYLEKYGCVPVFKAGIHDGLVMVTEVGKYKKEIAYHGDTVNTASRIQGKCNEFREELLISGCLMKKLNPTSFEFTPMGKVTLRGKKQHLAIYGVHEKNEMPVLSP